MIDELREFIYRNHFEMYEKEAYGIYRNRNLTISQTFTTINVSIAFNQPIGQELARNISNQITTIKKEHTALLQGFTTNLGIMLQIYQSENCISEMAIIVDAIISVLESFNMPTCERCPICGQNLVPSDPFVKTQIGIVQMHDHCAKQMLNATETFKKSLDNKTKKQFLLSTIVAVGLMVALIGINCLLAKAGYITIGITISSWVYFVIYRLIMAALKVIPTKKQVIVTAITSILMLLISLFLCTAIDMNNRIESLTLLEIFKNYFVLLKNNFAEYTSQILLYSFLAFVIIGLNIFSSYRQISFTDRNQAKIIRK